MQKKLSPALVVDVIGIPALILVSHGLPIEFVGFFDVVAGLKCGRRHVQFQAESLLVDAMILNQFLFRPFRAFHVSGGNVLSTKLLQGRLVLLARGEETLDLFNVGRINRFLGILG